ncbi:MAG: twin-arginine translocase TatA/TatE family subunit [Crocinitomicaceae bacterium]|nr:twin-arginine translocase TatA/TatE family subunit [Crocinitomicaceae bacterium]MDG1776824.1 twin-arginine translocase TatA/TatE family subunit [Crocinitomicaceae bacterium]
MVLILNDVAGSEILLILVFVLIFFGSKSIPGLAQTLGRTIRQVKEASNDIQNEIKKSGAEMKKDLNLEGFIKDTTEEIRRPLDQMASDIDSTIKYQPAKRNVEITPVEEKTEVTPLAEPTPDDSLKTKHPKKEVAGTDSENTSQKTV